MWRFCKVLTLVLTLVFLSLVSMHTSLEGFNCHRVCLPRPDLSHEPHIPCSACSIQSQPSLHVCSFNLRYAACLNSDHDSRRETESLDTIFTNCILDLWQVAG